MMFWMVIFGQRGLGIKKPHLVKIKGTWYALGKYHWGCGMSPLEAFGEFFSKTTQQQ